MNAVQSHLSTNGIWDRDHDDFGLTTFSSVLRYRAKIARASTEEEQARGPKKPINKYIEEDLQPAIDALVKREENRKKAIRDKAQEVAAAKKRKRQEDEEREREMNKKRKVEEKERKMNKREEDEEREQEMNKKLSTLTKKLHKLRDSVDEEMGDVRVGLHRKFLKFEGMILDMMVPSDVTGEDNNGDDSNSDSDDGSGDD